MVLPPAVPVSILAGLAGAAAIFLASGRPRAELLLRDFLQWRERQRQGATLLELDDRLLHDVGLTRHQAEHEGRRND